MAVHDVDALDAEAIAAWKGGADKRTYVRRMFSEIAPRYDLLNHLLSLSLDRGWRRKALAALQWQRQPEGLYLDLCAGTLDVGAALARTTGFAGSILSADFAEPMLRAGLGKAPPRVVCPVVADALDLPLGDESTSGAIVAFGIRNLADLDAGLAEVHRVLAPGARFVILEFSTPRLWFARVGYHAYFHHVLPFIGGVVSGHRTAYRYLPESVANFPSTAELATRMTRVGFADVTWRSLTFGVAVIHVGIKA